MNFQNPMGKLNSPDPSSPYLTQPNPLTLPLPTPPLKHFRHNIPGFHGINHRVSINFVASRFVAEEFRYCKQGISQDDVTQRVFLLMVLGRGVNGQISGANQHIERQEVVLPKQMHMSVAM